MAVRLLPPGPGRDSGRARLRKARRQPSGVTCRCPAVRPSRTVSGALRGATVRGLAEHPDTARIDPQAVWACPAGTALGVTGATVQQPPGRREARPLRPGLASRFGCLGAGLGTPDHAGNGLRMPVAATLRLAIVRVEVHGNRPQ
jgi:hypothetical protein